jgi:hypothetical protein
MPVPGEGQEKKLSKIKKEVLGDGYFDGDGAGLFGGAGAPGSNTKLNAMEVDEEYGEINQASEDKPSGASPSTVDEWSNYDHNYSADVYGCTDATANNYNPLATLSDGSCTYTSGCTDSTACNYNPNATISTDTCTYPAQYEDCDGNCINDSDGDGICDEVEVSGCTISSANSGTTNLANALNIANGATDVIRVGNYNPNATDNNGSCAITYIGCFNEESFNYDQYSPLIDAISPGGVLYLSNVSQEIENDDSMCDFTPPQSWPEGEDPPHVNLKARRYKSGQDYPSTPIFTSSDPPLGGWTTDQDIGLTSAIKLKQIHFAGGPGNLSNIYWNDFNSNYYDHNSFIKRIMIYSQGYVDANNAYFYNSDWREEAEAANGAYQLYRFESANGWTHGYLNQFIDLYSMKMDHGGPIKLYIQLGPFHSSCCYPDEPDYAASPQQPVEGTHYNTGQAGAANNYTNDDPYYYRKAILRWEVSDINFTGNCVNCYDPMNASQGTEFGDEDIPFNGCRDALNLGDASNNNEDHWECPEGIDEYLQEIRQQWDFDDDGYPPEEEDDETEAEDNSGAAGGGR